MTKRFAILSVVFAGLIGPLFAESSGSGKSSGPPRSNEPTANRVLLLDGKTGYVQVRDSESLHSLKEEITIECWFKADSLCSGDGIVNSIVRKNISAGEENFFLRFRKYKDEPLLEVSPGGELGTLPATCVFEPGKWYHVAGTYDGKVIQVFVNGMLFETDQITGPLDIDASDLYIGKGDPEFSAGEYFHGAVDEIRIWNVVRSPEQIHSAMNAPLTGQEKGLVAYWNFDDGTARDVSSHGNNGNLHGEARIVDSPRPTAPAEQATIRTAETAKRPEPHGIPEGTRERARDGIVHIEKGVVLELPDVRPLCDKVDTEKRRVDIGDCELYCETEGEGTPLVLINGGPGSTHHDFHPAFSRAREFAKVIYYDQRGCGRSDWEAGDGHSVKQAVDDLDKLRKALGIEKWVVLGHSYGGLLAQSYCTAYPDNTAGLILVGSVEAMPVKLKPTRQYQFITGREQAKMQTARRQIERRMRAGEKIREELILFNNWLNGDWKRQNYYKPSREEIARGALYGWKHDKAFRRALGADSQKVDLTGAFQDCPVPTLILEGKWDLTWDTDKAEILQQNHPNSRLIMFEESAHNPFDDEPEAFFNTLKSFLVNLPEVPSAEVEQWKRHLATWREEKKKPLLTADRAARQESPADLVNRLGWGKRSNKEIASRFRNEWLDQISNPWHLLKTGFALYDAKRYGEALAVFEKMGEKAGADRRGEAIALIWQGHMLDLLGKRKEAISRYAKVARMGIETEQRHDQFGLSYSPSSYARQRISTPFTRVENLDSD